MFAFLQLELVHGLVEVLVLARSRLVSLGDHVRVRSCSRIGQGLTTLALPMMDSGVELLVLR